MDIQLKNELLAATGEGPLGRTPLVVNEANLNNELIFEQQIAIYNASQWHKIIVNIRGIIFSSHLIIYIAGS